LWLFDRVAVPSQQLLYPKEVLLVGCGLMPSTYDWACAEATSIRLLIFYVGSISLLLDAKLHSASLDVIFLIFEHCLLLRLEN